MDAPARTVAALALLAVVGVGAAMLLQAPDVEGSTGAYPVTVAGPEGELFNGTVHVSNATAHGALLAAAEQGGFEVRTASHAGYRPCGLYVEAVGGHEAEGASGWVYEVHREGAWSRPALGACAYPLHPGDMVRWRYVQA